MRRYFDEWKAEMLEKHPGVKINTIKQNGGLVGGFAFVDTQHVGSWPDYLIPGYEILEPAEDNYA